MKYLILLAGFLGSTAFAEPNLAGLWWERGSDRVLKIDPSGNLSACRILEGAVTCATPFATLHWDSANAWYDMNQFNNTLGNAVVRVLSRPYLRPDPSDSNVVHRGQDFFETKTYERLDQ